MNLPDMNCIDLVCYVNTNGFTSEVGFSLGKNWGFSLLEKLGEKFGWRSVLVFVIVDRKILSQMPSFPRRVCPCPEFWP